MIRWGLFDSPQKSAFRLDFYTLQLQKMNELKEKIKKLELELEDVKSARDCLVRYSQGLYNKILELEDELDKKSEIIAKIQSIIAK